MKEMLLKILFATCSLQEDLCFDRVDKICATRPTRSEEMQCFYNERAMCELDFELCLKPKHYPNPNG